MFNGSLEGWDVRNVHWMTGMFQGCHHFNRPLSTWRVVNVRCMTRMFYDARTFAHSLKGWQLAAYREGMLDGADAYWWMVAKMEDRSKRRRLHSDSGGSR